jgi:hypothetical protein
MNIFKMQFCHPIKGTMHLMGVDAKNIQHIFPVDSQGKDVLEVPLDGFEKGHWKILLEWEHEGREFVIKKDITIS